MSGESVVKVTKTTPHASEFASSPAGIDRPSWWPEHLATPPPEGCFPRIETEHHPKAVGTYGPAVVAHAVGYGLQPRWWAQFALARLLEHDSDGRLCWAETAVSTARQQGKGFSLLRPLAAWRFEASAELFGERQTILHMANQVSSVLEHVQPWFPVARERGHKTRLTNGEQGIFSPDGDRWLLRAGRGGYGISSNLAMLDETWNLAPAVLDSMILPVMAERSNPLLVLTSTANALCSPTYPRFRDAANVGDRRLVLEWSAPPEVPVGDETFWRWASPHWSDQRAEIMRRALSRVVGAPTDFECEWLNRWPVLGVDVSRKVFPRWSDLPDHGVAWPKNGGIACIDEDVDGSRVGVLLLRNDDVWFKWVDSVASAVRLVTFADEVVVGLSLTVPVVGAGLQHVPVKAGVKESRLGMAHAQHRYGDLRHDRGGVDEFCAAAMQETESGWVLARRASRLSVLPAKLLVWALWFQRNNAHGVATVW